MALFTSKHVKYLFANCPINKNEYGIEKFIRKNLNCTARVLGNIVPFNLSDIGEGIREVAIKEWFVKEGDKVSQFDSICEVQSDKASVNITSRYDGIIRKIHYEVDQTAFVGKPLIDIEVEQGNEVNIEHKGGDTEEIIKTKEQILKEPNTKTNISENNYALCIPSVRRLARQYKIDLRNVKGTGKKSRILKEDILRYLQKIGQKNEQKREATDYTSTDESIKIKGFQKAMLKTMSESLKIPHFVYTEEISVTKLSKLRKELNFNSELGVRLSFVPFFIKALSLALSEYPILNSSLDLENESVRMKKNHNLGIAMDTKVGLAVPVIRNIRNLSLLDIAKELQRLMEKGKEGNFSLDDMNDGTFTFSNIGVIGGLHASPVILTPQVAIVAIGSVKLLPRFNKELQVIPEEIVNMSGAADHRIIDGATMANFVNLVKKYIENPYLLMLKS